MKCSRDKDAMSLGPRARRYSAAHCSYYGLCRSGTLMLTILAQLSEN